MSDVVLFSFEGSGVRVVERDGEPWFVARDVALLLGYAAPRNAVRDHCKGGTETMLPSASGIQPTIIIPERDVYRLIMRSKLPAAERFEEWVVGDVLPSIRKHGGYVAGQESMEPAEVLARAVLVANSVIAEKQKRIEALEPVAGTMERNSPARLHRTRMDAL